MKNSKLGIGLITIILFTFSCTSEKKISQDDEFATEATIAAAGSDGELSLDDTDNASTESQSTAQGGTDEFAEFDNAPAKDTAKNSSGEDDLEKELSQMQGSNTAATSPNDELTLEPDKLLDTPPAPELTKNSNADLATPAPEVAVQPSAPIAEPAIDNSNANPLPSADSVSQINSVQYQANQSGGTVVINSSQPLQFTTRMNSATNQLIVEVQNSVIPKKLKRTLNTKDMASSIGSVDIYQKANSKVSRFVVQLRPGASEPLVQPEGTSLLIVGGANAAYADSKANKGDSESVASTTATQPQEVNPDLTSEGIMSSQNLEEFLASNNKFYGKKISIEANKIDINDAFKFLSEESSVNMIIDDGVKGEVSLKLRQVPWDQAFVLILKSKKLGYKRQGNVIRIAAVDTLLKEEDDAIKLQEARRSNEPLSVRRFFIGYADIADLEKKIKDFISTSVTSATGQTTQTASRGKVISDVRTSSLIVTETPTNMIKIEKLILALDSQPRQVLIEGKVVEAQEKFARGLGIDWATGARDLPTDAIIKPTTNFVSSDLGIGSLTSTLGIGKFGALGSLDATLKLGEKQSKIRVLSSPRISVLSNQPATITQTVSIQIPTSSTTAPTTGAIQVTYTTVNAGVSLKVTPQISNEGTVVMDLDIERSFLSDAISSSIEKRNAKTKVIVKSGQTAVIGGIFQADTTESSSGIPFLRDIPLLGFAFGGRNVNKSKNELVIFVTPRIQKSVQADTAVGSSLE